MKRITSLALGATCCAAALAGETPALPPLLFHAPFDGSPVAATAAGQAEPVEAQGLDWGDGTLPGSRALLMRRSAPGGAAPRLAYAATGNLPLERGTVALWTRREWDFAAPAQPWRCLFATPMPGGDRNKKRIGSGALWFWWYGDILRAEQSDPDDDNRRVGDIPLTGDWFHLAFSWQPGRVEVFVNGKRRRILRDGDSPLRDAIAEEKALAHPLDRSWIDRFFIGNLDGADIADSLIADFRIYGAALTEAQVREVLQPAAPAAGTGGERVLQPAAPAAGIGGARVLQPAAPAAGTGGAPTLPAAIPPGRHTRAPFSGEAPGTIAPEALELVDEVRLREESGGSGAPPVGRNFRSVGPLRRGSLDGAAYLEAGSGKGDRFAVPLRLAADAALHLIEIDVPDDALRTEDLIVQPADGSTDYALQVGLLLGGEYPNSGTMLTHRCLYWTRTNEVALVAMTAREGAPAAIAAIRAYAVKNAALPSCLEDEREAPYSQDSRHAAIYYEDPALNFAFGIPRDETATPAGFAEELSRLTATMKFTGLDTLFYPGAWYQGLIEAGGYNPRNHAPRWRDILYQAFDAEGLRFIPTINFNNIPWEPGAVTAAALTNGSLHATPIAIHDTGKPNPGRWHNTPPNYNFYHPDVQREIARVFDTLVAEGARHPSFAGVCLHLTQHCCLWWGSAKSGYNDYAVEAFCRERGLKPPAPIAAASCREGEREASNSDRARPLLASCREGEREAPHSRALRGADYAAWLRSDPARWEAWIQWRCDQVSAFYASLAARLAAAHPGAKLYLNNFVPPDLNDPDFGKPGFTLASARGRGLDIPALERAIPNLVVMQTSVPADYRWGYADRYFRFDDPARRAAAIDYIRDLDSSTDFWSPLGETAHPWANIHDRYWESAIGMGGGTLTGDGFTECTWRVSTLNPGGANALRHWLAPLRHHDALGLSKGGFLVGTYGMEAQLAPFLSAFRSLPPVALPELPESTETVKVRGGEWHGTNYLYAVNTGATNATVALPSGPVTLAPGSMQVFSQP